MKILYSEFFAMRSRHVPMGRENYLARESLRPRIHRNLHFYVKFQSLAWRACLEYNENSREMQINITRCEARRLREAEGLFKVPSLRGCITRRQVASRPLRARDLK